MEPRSPSKSNHPRFRKLTILLLFLILGVLVGLGGYYLFFRQQFLVPTTYFFTVVLDCGSTGSRVNIYEWRITSSSGYENLPFLLHSYPQNVNTSTGCRYHCMQTQPGLHTFVNNGSRVSAALALIPLIRYAETQVPLERRSHTPIFVLATAGMRSLALADAARVLGDVENVVKQHGFLYRKSWIRVLSGKEEAYYGWVALNYKMGLFRSSARSSTLGLLDLGGSSLQVVAEVDGSMKDENLFRSKIGPFEHDIVAYSLPAFGLNEAFDRTVIMLSHSQALGESVAGMFEVKHPCLDSGFVQNYTCRGCFQLDSSYSRNSSNQIQVNELNSVFLVGEPNWEQCKILARAAAVNSTSLELLNKVHGSNCMGLSSYGGNAKLNLTKSSHTVKRYHALSGFFAISHALNLSERANLSMLWESGERLCARSLKEQQCFRVPYLTSLIENALCLGGVEIIFGPPDVSWTLGASLIEGEFLWLHGEKPQNYIFTLKGNYMISSPLLTFVLLLSLLLIVYCCQVKLPMPSRKVTVASRTTLPTYLYPKRQPN